MLVAHNLSEAAATGLQHHVGGAGSFLWQYHAGETLAVPPLLADLYEQDDFDTRERRVERGKGCGSSLGLRILFVAAMVFQYHVGRVHAIVGNNLCHLWVDVLLKRLYLTAIDGQLGTSAVGVSRVAILVEELPHAIVDDHGPVVVGELHLGHLEEVAHALDERIVIHHIGEVGVADGEVTGQRQTLGLFEIGRAREAHHGVEGVVLCPLVDHLPELDLAVGSMVHLVDEDGEVGQLADDVAQLIGHFHLLQLLLAEKRGISGVCHSVEDHFLGIGDGHEAHQVVQGLVVVYFLRVGVSDDVALACALLLVERLKLDEACQLCGRGLGYDP